MSRLPLLLSLAWLASACTPAPVVPAAPVPEADPQPRAVTDATVRSQLDTGAMLLSAEGYARQGEYLGGSLADGGETDFILRLGGGAEYLILGVCDAECDDLDLSLADATGNVVDADYELDDVPIVTVTVARDAAYRLTASMASCDADSCAIGIAVFVRR